MLVLSNKRGKNHPLPGREIRSKDDLQMEKYEVLFRNNTIGTSCFFKPMNPPPFSLTNVTEHNSHSACTSNDSNSVVITPGNQNKADNLPLPNYHDASTHEGNATHDAAILLTSIKNLAHKEISCKPRSVSIHLPSIPDLERHFKRPSSSPQQGITVDKVMMASFTKCIPRTSEACLTSRLSVPMSDTSRIRTVSMDSHHQFENEAQRSDSPPSRPKALIQVSKATTSSPQKYVPIQAVEHQSFCVSPNVPSSLSALHVIPTETLKSPKRNVDRRKRYLDAHKEEELEASHEDEENGSGILAECQNIVLNENVPRNGKQKHNHSGPPTKKQKLSATATTATSAARQTPKSQDHPQDSSANAKAILRKKFSWKNYPELEEFLIANREEYLRHSALNYTMEQKQYNNRLTERLIELASECGYVFDQDSFTFVSIRDRIRCYFKSYVQSRKKRGVIIGYAAKKAGLLDEQKLEKNSGSKAKIVSVSKPRGKKL